MEVYLAAFGKHPGWNDFMDDLGIETPRLADFRQMFIERGLKVSVEGAKWENREPGQVLDGFAHEFVYRGGGDIIVGRLWSSRDGKGRSSYPMIVCVQLRGVSMDDALGSILPSLQAVQSQCEQATTKGQVIEVLESARDALRTRAAGFDAARTDLRLSPDVPRELADRPALGPQRQGFHRIMYQMDRELAPFLRGQSAPRSRIGTADASRALRVPLAFEPPAAALSKWLSLVYLRVEPWCPVMLVRPISDSPTTAAGWLDIIAGEPAGPELFCLKASPSAIPMASDIPYTIDAATAARFDQFVTDAAQMQPESLRAVMPTSGGATQSGTRLAPAGAGPGRGVIVLAVLLGLLLLGSLLFLVMGSRKSASKTASDDPSQTASLPVAPQPVRHDVAAPSGAAAAADPAQPAWEDGPWKSLCTNYHQWFALLLRRMEEPPRSELFDGSFPRRLDVYQREPALASALALIEQSGLRPGASVRTSSSDPWTIGKVSSDRDLLALARNAPEAARSDAGRQATTESLRAIESIRRSLDQWSEPAQLRITGEELRQSGFGPAAELLLRIADYARPPVDADQPPADLAVGIDGVLAVRDVAASVSRRHQSIRGAMRAVESDSLAQSDRVIGLFPAWARSQLAASAALLTAGPAGATSMSGEALTLSAIVAGVARLRALDDSLAAASDLAAAISNFMQKSWAEVDHDMLAAEAPVYSLAAREPDAALFRDWLYQAPRYRSLDPATDPRRSWDREALTSSISAAIKVLGDPKLGVSDAIVVELRRRAEELSKRAEDLAARPWTRREASDIAGELPVLLAAQQQLRRDAERTVQDAQAAQGATAAASRDELKSRDRIVVDSEVINGFWRQQRDRVLARYDQASFKDMLAHARRIEDALVKLSTDAPARLGASASKSRWAEPLMAELRRRREARFAQALGRWADELMDPAEEGVREQLQAVAADLIAAADSLTSIVASADAAEQSLDAGQAAGAFLTLVDREPLLKDAGFRTALASLIDRVQRVAAIEQEQDVAALLERVAPIVHPAQGATPPEPEVVVAVWRRLGIQLGGAPGSTARRIWPVLPEELDIDARLAEEVRSIASAAADRARGQALVAEVEAEQSRRVKRMLLRGETDGSIEAAAAFLSKLGISTADLDARARFNVLLQTLRKSLAAGTSDAQASAAAREFLTSVTALPGGAGFAADAAAGVRAVESELQSQPAAPAPIDPITLGPGSTARFQGRVEGDRLIFQSAGGPAFEFVRVDVAPGETSGDKPDPIFILTSEVSLAMFQAIARAVPSAQPPVLAQWLPAGEADTDSRLGPRTWEWDPRAGVGRAIMVARDWLSVAPANAPFQYAPNEQPGRPTLDHPMNYVPPHAAAVAAAQVGCRLPTTAEWLAVTRRFAADTEPGKSNLRDQTWARHKSHVDAVIAKGRNLQPADAGSYVPSGGEVSPTDDRLLWFGPVGVGDGLVKNLRGNVAEWLLDPCDVPVPPSLEGTAAEAFIRACADKFFVAGASAMSDAAPAAASPRKVDLAEAIVGFADVGFRLVFSGRGAGAPAPSLAQRLQQAAREARYLKPREP